MFDLSRHPYFTEYIDPKSKVKSYVLTEKIAPLQQHFYFAQPSVTEDGKYLWLYCAYPPATYMVLAVVSLDPDNPFYRVFPHAARVEDGGYPCITPEGDGVYFGAGNTLYKLDVEGNLTKILTVGNDILQNRKITRLFTHASISPDNKYIALDMIIGNKWYMAIGDIHTGEIKMLNKYGRCYDHAMFSPKDPNLILLDQDWWRDADTVEYFPINNRMWLLTTDGKSFQPALKNSFYWHDGTEIAHDYWSGDGHLCWADYPNGAYELDEETGQSVCVWKRPVCHSHCTHHREYFVADQSPYIWKNTPCRVLFFDRKTNKEVDIFSALPYLEILGNRWFHSDPHPQFCAKDSMVVATVTVFGAITVAITDIEELKTKCQENGYVVGSEK